MTLHGSPARRAPEPRSRRWRCTRLMSAAIESYGLIGDCQTAALVGRDGSIDWLCWPRFDSDACFAALIGKPSHGRWLISPSEDAIEVSRCYRRDTLVLETTFRTATGKVTVIDFMQPRGRSSDLIRLVRGDEGEVSMCMELGCVSATARPCHGSAA